MARIPPPPSQARYDIQQLAQLWLSVGGSTHTMVDAVAIALAESGGDPTAVSPSHDYGLWQINTINFPAYHLTVDSAFDPVRNAEVAYSISGGGSNWAAWCTAWDNPGPNCGHGYLPHVQLLSAAGARLSEVGGVLRTSPPAPVPTGPTANLDSVTAAWGHLQRMMGSWAPAEWLRWHDLGVHSQSARR